MNGFSNWQAPLWKDETKRVKYFDIPLYGRFDVISPMAVNGLWQVVYTSKGVTYTGYIDDRFMEYYTEGMPSDIVDLSAIQTPEPYDAQQYVLWDAKKQYNMCGQISVSDILGLPLAEVLTRWKTLDVPFYKRIFGSSGTTNNDDLIRLLGLFGVIGRKLNIPKYTPRLFSELVKTSRGVIVSVHLNTFSGSLNGSGVLHWVRVLDVIPERFDMGQVLVYNPYGNAHEWYSWREFLATTRSPYGVIV